MEVRSGTILSGASVSDDLGDVTGLTLVGLYIPGSWTTAAISFQASLDGGSTWVNVFARNDSGDLVFSSGTVGAGGCVLLASPLAGFQLVGHLRVRSGTTATPVNQGGDRAFSAFFQKIVPGNAKL